MGSIESVQREAGRVKRGPAPRSGPVRCLGGSMGPHPNAGTARKHTHFCPVPCLATCRVRGTAGVPGSARGRGISAPAREQTIACDGAHEDMSRIASTAIAACRCQEI